MCLFWPHGRWSSLLLNTCNAPSIEFEIKVCWACLLTFDRHTTLLHTICFIHTDTSTFGKDRQKKSQIERCRVLWKLHASDDFSQAVKLQFGLPWSEDSDRVGGLARELKLGFRSISSLFILWDVEKAGEDCTISISFVLATRLGELLLLTTRSVEVEDFFCCSSTCPIEDHTVARTAQWRETYVLDQRIDSRISWFSVVKVEMMTASWMQTGTIKELAKIPSIWLNLFWKVLPLWMLRVPRVSRYAWKNRMAEQYKLETNCKTNSASINLMVRIALLAANSPPSAVLLSLS